MTEILFERAMWHYARGIAFLGKNDVEAALEAPEGPAPDVARSRISPYRGDVTHA